MLQVFQAFDRELIAEIETDDEASLDRKLSTASEAFADRTSWLEPHERIAILRKVADSLDSQKDAFALMIAREGGKPLRDAAAEVVRAVDGVRNAADELRTFAGREILMGLSPASTNRWAFTTKEPIGVVAAISAFNHPLNLIVHQVVPAIATGCPVIVKPADRTPLSCLEFVKLVHEAGLPEAWCQTLITADTALAESLATSPRIAFLSFIGSARVGWYLHSKLAPGVRSALEHGGAAPAIIDRSADLEAVLDPLVRGGFYHAGQVCVSTQRVYVHDAVFQEMADRLIAKVSSLQTGDPTFEKTDVGPLITPREVDRVADWVAEAVASSVAPAVGGTRLSKTLFEPTILLDPAPDVRVSREEIFGPVMALYRYKDLSDALARANSLPVAFQASIFAQDLDVALSAAHGLEASAVMVNDATTFRTDWMPFAGRRVSGYGTGGIGYTMQDMTHEKMIILRRR